MDKTKETSFPFYWHILLLCSLVFSQPLFNILGNQPEFLLAHNLQGLNLLLWIVVVAFIPGIVISALIYILTKAFPALEGIIKTGSLFVLVGLFFFIQMKDSLGASPLLLFIVSCLLAIVTLFIYARSIHLRTFFSFAAFMVVILPVIFSLGTEVRQILLPQQDTGNTAASGPIDKNPVVVLILDEVSIFSLLDSGGNINAERFPNFAEFSGQSTWYKYATTVAEATLNAVPPIVTGQLTVSRDKKLPLAANYPENLFTLLAASHEVNAFETFTQICPGDLCKSARPDWRMIAEDTLVVYAHLTAPDKVKQKLPQIDNKWAGYLRTEEEINDLHTDKGLHPHHRYKVRLEKFGRFMSELEYISPASLNYLHILMPHSPWMYLPDGRLYAQTELRPFTGTLPPGSVGAKQKSQLYSQAHISDHIYQRHILQLGYVDKLLGDVLSLLRKRDMFEDAIVIVMGDHGVSFKPGESLREANEPSFQDILSVPLFIKYPGQKHSETSLRAARTVDILPTILDALNSKFDNPDFGGKSLLQADEAEQTTLGLQRDTGEILEFQFSEFKDRFNATVKSRKPALTNGSMDQIYGLNDEGLLNKAVEDLPISNPVDYTLQLDNPHLYKDIDLSQNSIPTLIRANPSAQSTQPVVATVAVSINGIIRGVSQLQHVDTVEFDYQVLVAPESFQSGSNVINFYRVDKTGEPTSLSPLHYETANQAELKNGADGSLQLIFNAHQLPVASTGNHGEVNMDADAESNQIRLLGWSASSHSGLIADEIFFFSGNRLITSIKPHSSIPRAQEITGFANTENSGFSLVLPINENAKPESFTAIAVFDSDTNPVAGELSYINRVRNLLKTRHIKKDHQTLVEKSDKNIIKHGRIYDFSDDTEALLFTGSGWSKTSGNGSRWNFTSEATLGFKVKGNNLPLELLVESLPFFVEGKHTSQVIEATFPSGNRQLINLQRGQTDGSFTIHIAVEDIGTDGTVVIKLRFLNAASPKSLGVNDDPRLLAIKVKTIQVLTASKP